MGRRGIRPQDGQRWIFNRLAGAYAHRPGYPEALVRRLAEIAGPPPAARVADLGAGTGHLALPLAALGLTVAAVEPAEQMLAALRAEAETRGLTTVEPVHAAAEETGLAAGAYALVLLADALHWVDPELTGRELARLCAPRGACAVVEAELGGTPFIDALLARMAEANPRARKPPQRPLTQLFALAAPGAPLRTERFHDMQTLDAAALEGALRSLSYVGPALGDEKVAELVGTARALAAEHGGAQWGRTITLTWARNR